MVLQMAPDALGVIGLPCISYIFMNSFTHGRTSDKPYGNESTREYVKLANVKLDDRLGVGWWQVSTQVGPQKMDPTKSTKCSISPQDFSKGLGAGSIFVGQPKRKSSREGVADGY